MDAEDKRQVLPLLAAITGLIAGVFSFLVFLLITANLYAWVQRFIPFPRNPDSETMLFFNLGLYAIWLLAIWRMVRKIPVVFWFLVMLPLPSILVGYNWAEGLEERWGHKAETQGAIIGVGFVATAWEGDGRFWSFRNWGDVRLVSAKRRRADIDQVAPVDL
jgi:hypothetical protein